MGDCTISWAKKKTFFGMESSFLWGFVVVLIWIGGSPGFPLLSWWSPDGYEPDVYEFLNLLSDNWIFQVAAVRERKETRTIKAGK